MPQKRRPLYNLFLATLLQGSLVLHADWILIDDFESYDPGLYLSNDSNLLYPGASNGGTGATSIWTGVEGTGGEKAAWFWNGTSIPGDFYHQIPLPVEISVNEVGTLYFRIWQVAKDLNWYVMISKVAAGEEPDNLAIYENQAAILRYNMAEPEGSLYARDGGNYLLPQPAFSPAPASWYEYWIILDNAYDGVVQADTAGYAIYRKGPTDTWPNLMDWGTDQTRTKLHMRNQAFDSLKAIVLLQRLQFETNIWLIDDIYMTLGTCLSDPRTGAICESWCDYPVIDGHADTGSWLGWVYVDSDPWVYSYLLGSWLYVPTCPQAAGAWVYLSK